MEEVEVLYRAPDGRVLTAGDLVHDGGPLPGAPPEAEPPNATAGRLHAEGRRLGALGRYDEALGRFAEASEAAPGWPFPEYDAAFTHLYRSDADAAARAFERVEAMAPWGFLNTQVALDTLRRAREGRAHAEVLVTLTLAEVDPDPSRRRLVLEAIARANPEVPRAWQLLAEVAPDRATRMQCVERGLAASPDPTTGGMLRVHRAWTWFVSGRREDAIAELGALALDEGTPRDVARRARWALARLLFG